MRLALVALVLLAQSKPDVLVVRGGRIVPISGPEIENGMILILDNQGRGDGRSRVLEIDPLTQRVVWSYEGDDAHPFFTRFNGSVQRLRNGDTLIVESDGGRAFEVDEGRRIVWEFFNPHRAGKDGELIASLFDLMRIDAPR